MTARHARLPALVLMVREPMLWPLPAAAGDALTVWPGHTTHALAVVRPDHRIRAHRAATAHELRRVARQVLADRTAIPAAHRCAAALEVLAHRGAAALLTLPVAPPDLGDLLEQVRRQADDIRALAEGLAKGAG